MKEKNKNDGTANTSGKTFKDHQRTMDKALNKNDEENKDGSTGERRLKTDVSQKKTGGGKQVSPGD